MLAYEDFKNNIRSDVLNFFPEEYAGSTVDIQSVKKNNGITLDGLVIQKPGTNIYPTIYLNDMYKDYESGSKSLDDIFGDIVKMEIEYSVDKEFDVNLLKDYENVRGNVIPRIVNAKANEERLADMPHKMYGDLAITYYIKLGDTDGVIASTAISNEMLNIYGISVDELHEAALSNIEEKVPSHFLSMKEMLASTMISEYNTLSPEEKAAMMEDIMPGDHNPGMYILTNKDKSYGASALLSDKIMDEIKEKIGDFYILPSSVHEVILLAKDDMMELSELENLVQEVNRTQVSASDLLSDHVYSYDYDTREIYRADKEAEFIEHKKEVLANKSQKNKQPVLKSKLDKNKETIENSKGDVKEVKHKKKETSL